ncbi:MAG: hypothetical protein U1A25_00365 [Candidatus Sungbacteria bacterium]|nr:hypothetical protein [bacterium]MDZ4260097.1 hypothetical protein [Candidatus Sungbacteria bacterium]
MAIRIISGIVLIILVFLVLIPLGLRWAGIDILPSRGGSTPAPAVQRQGSAQEVFGVLARSVDAGARWKNAALSENPSIPFPGIIFSFVIHPQNPDTLYVGSKGNGLWRSINGGRTWNKMMDTARVIDPAADVYDVEIISGEPDVLYIAVFQNNHGRVLKSEDLGTTWREVYATSADKTVVFDISIDRLNTDHLLIATGENALFESSNGGMTWRVKKWFTESPLKILVNPRNSSELYVITSGGNVLKSATGGTQWGNLNVSAKEQESDSGVVLEQYPQGLFSFFGQSSNTSSRKLFLLDPTNPSRIYVSSSEGLLRSVDGGFTWKSIDLLLPNSLLPVTAVAISPGDASTIYVAAANEIHKSIDGGMTWSVTRLSIGVRIMGLIIHPSDPEIMFAILSK